MDSIERDEVLLRRSARGDEDSFAALYQRHQAPLYRFALRMTGNAWAAEEIVQDVFMTLMRDPKKYDVDRGSLGAFLYGVTRNRVMKHVERTPRDCRCWKAMKMATQFFRKQSIQPLPRIGRKLASAVLWCARPFSICQRSFERAVVLCLLEELSYEEAASLLECPVGTIRSRLHRGRALLLAKLEILREVPKRAGATR